jgi:DNA-binding NarL/FixJ family response regulator
VAGLVADGLSNRQIANALVITERTAEAYVGHILDKLGFSSRTQIGVWAAARAKRLP